MNTTSRKAPSSAVRRVTPGSGRSTLEQPAISHGSAAPGSLNLSAEPHDFVHCDEELGQTRKRGRPFELGNTFGKGRPPGSKNKRSQVLEDMLLDAGPEIFQKIIAYAKKGNSTAMKICAERLIPKLKDTDQLAVEKEQAGAVKINVVFVE